MAKIIERPSVAEEQREELRCRLKTIAVKLEVSPDSAACRSRR